MVSLAMEVEDKLGLLELVAGHLSLLSGHLGWEIRFQQLLV